MEEMLNVPHPPSIARNEFNCPHCGAHSSQTWFTLAPEPIEKGGTPNIHNADEIAANSTLVEVRKDDVKWAKNMVSKRESVSKREKQEEYSCYTVHNLHLSKCFTCENFSVWVHDSLLFPKKLYVVPPNPDLPDDIRRDYEEAGAILDISPRGSAALLRLAIQKLCIHLGEPGKNINNDIASLVKKGLDQRVQQALDVVRVIGNNAVHPGHMDVTDDKDTASTLFRLVNLIAEKMISEPKHVQSLFDSLPESTREQIEKRDK
ncbi:DUF4145 domain-containing protein [Candidatus Electronema sp. PJ]|uniref:DUF4145 domain-containing protein n=1 Tax=Candidatus Electronema sp. PJ TaxID=3401572 RepID=UPI003AA7EC09